MEDELRQRMIEYGLTAERQQREREERHSRWDDYTTHCVYFGCVSCDDSDLGVVLNACLTDTIESFAR